MTSSLCNHDVLNGRKLVDFQFHCSSSVSGHLRRHVHHEESFKSISFRVDASPELVQLFTGQCLSAAATAKNKGDVKAHALWEKRKKIISQTSSLVIDIDWNEGAPEKPVSISGSIVVCAKCGQLTPSVDEVAVLAATAKADLNALKAMMDNLITSAQAKL